MYAVNIMSIGTNIRHYRKAKSLRQEDLADKVDVTKSMISLYESDKSIPPLDKLSSMAQHLGVKVNDLLSEEPLVEYGSTDKKKNSSLLTNIHPNTNVVIQNEAEPLDVVDPSDPSMTAFGMEFRELSNGSYLMTIPLVEQHAYAGYLSGWKDREYIEELPKHSFITDKIHTGLYRAFQVRGDSMDDNTRDAICDGDVVECRRLFADAWKHKLHIHTHPDFLIVHQDGVVVKRVIEHDVENGIIFCASLNPNKELYPNTYYRLSEVYELYTIIGLGRKRRR